MRPFYETEQDRENETRVVAFLAQKWNFDFEKMHSNLNLDYAILEKNGGKHPKIVAFLEVKCRKRTFLEINKMGGVMLSAQKWIAGCRISNEFNVPFILAIKCIDVLAVATVRGSSESAKMKLMMMGRSDRKDLQDREPCVAIPENLFTKMYNVSDFDPPAE